jgi:hypothetical protein
MSPNISPFSAILPFIGLPFLLALIGLGVIFWIWMIVDCATEESNAENERLVWIVIVIGAQIIGALIYFFVRRPKRRAGLGY